MAAARKVLHLRRMAKGRPMNGVAVSMPAPAYWKPRPVAACAGLQYRTSLSMPLENNVRYSALPAALLLC